MKVGFTNVADQHDIDSETVTIPTTTAAIVAEIPADIGTTMPLRGSGSRKLRFILDYINTDRPEDLDTSLFVLSPPWVLDLLFSLPYLPCLDFLVTVITCAFVNNSP